MHFCGVFFLNPEHLMSMSPYLGIYEGSIILGKKRGNFHSNFIYSEGL